MNIIESIQRKYLPGFYESRYTSRKALALSLKQQCLADPSRLSIYELKIILKVLQQFKLLPREPGLEAKEGELKVKILESSVGSSVVSLVPFAVREFHRMRPLVKLVTVGGLFVGANYAQMRTYFKEYVEECGRVAQSNIGKLVEDSILPLE